MKREVYESQKAFAGEKKPSMLRRCVDHDYTDRMMYMVTMVTEGRRPLFGKVVGRSNASLDSPDAPRMELNELGRRVEACWYEIAVRQPKIKLIALQMMPDHFHGILFVTERLERSLGSVLLGFKQGCNKAFREVLSVAVVRQQTEPNDRTHGLLFTPGFNDKLLLRQGQLQRWIDYLRDNPRRLLMKRENPDLFRVQRDLMVAGQQFSAIGNRFLLDRPLLLQVQCSRRLTEEQIQEKKEQLLALARRGAVLVSPSISTGEKASVLWATNPEWGRKVCDIIPRLDSLHIPFKHSKKAEAKGKKDTYDAREMAYMVKWSGVSMMSEDGKEVIDERNEKQFYLYLQDHYEGEFLLPTWQAVCKERSFCYSQGISMQEMANSFAAHLPQQIDAA